MLVVDILTMLSGRILILGEKGVYHHHALPYVATLPLLMTLVLNADSPDLFLEDLNLRHSNELSPLGNST